VSGRVVSEVGEPGQGKPSSGSSLADAYAANILMCREAPSETSLRTLKFLPEKNTVDREPPRSNPINNEREDNTVRESNPVMTNNMSSNVTNLVTNPNAKVTNPVTNPPSPVTKPTRFIVDLVQLGSTGENTGFTEEDLKAYQQTWSPAIRETRPEIFGDECVGGLRWVRTEIIPMNIIDPRIDQVDKIQGCIRAGKNPAWEDIRSDIAENGWDNRELGICVVINEFGDTLDKFQVVDGTARQYYVTVGEGTTRNLIQRGFGMPNQICEVFEWVDKTKDKDDFSMFMNNYGHARGKTDEASLKVYVTAKIEKRGYAIAEMTAKEILAVTKEILSNLKMKISDKEERDIQKSLMKTAGVFPYESLDKAACDLRLEEMNAESESTVYLSMGSDPDSLRFLVRYLASESPADRALRKNILLVPYRASLPVENSEKAFYALAGSGALMEKSIRLIFDNADRIPNFSGIFPQIPQVWDKFEKGKLIEIPSDTTLEEMMEERS